MERNKLELSPKVITGFDLDSLVRKADQLNLENRQTYAIPFPKNPSRWRSHYHFEPRPIAFTCEGEVEGGLNWLAGSLFDFSFTRSLFAVLYSKEGGPCFDPASLFSLELAAKLDGYCDYASFCRDLRQQDKGEHYRQIAGIEDSIPGEDDLCHFRARVGCESINSILNVFVTFLNKEFSLINGEVLCTDGQLEPSYSRYRGCAFFSPECREFLLGKSACQQLHEQIDSGAKRILITCPFPAAVEKIREAMKKKDFEPKVALLEIEYLPDAGKSDADKLAKLLSLNEGLLPPLAIKWSRITMDEEGRLLGNCPKAPSDLEARVGYHIDNENPEKKERVFGYLQQRTTAVNVVLGLELPVANSTYPANANEGNLFLSHREKAAVSYQPGQLNCMDAAYDQNRIYRALSAKDAIALIAYNPRNENLSEEALRQRGYDRCGTPYAPCGRLCRSNGYNYDSRSRQYICGLACSEQERKQCAHGKKTWGYTRRMSFKDYPRLIGPIRRGSDDWQIFYGLRTASERTNSYSQEVIEEGRRLRLRGIKAFSFAGAIGALTQLLRRALNFVLDVTYTLGRLHPLRV
jgi:hypothetical protein